MLAAWPALMRYSAGSGTAVRFESNTHRAELFLILRCVTGWALSEWRITHLL